MSVTTLNKDWYGLKPKRSKFQQGDIIFGLPILELKYINFTEGEYSSSSGVGIMAKEVIYDVVIISHSCDIEDGTVDLVGYQLLPVYRYTEHQSILEISNETMLNIATNRKVPTHHTLEKCTIDGLVDDYLVVELAKLKVVTAVEFEKAITRASAIVRLKVPFREQLAFRFSNLYSRIALPVEITKPPKNIQENNKTL